MFTVYYYNERLDKWIKACEETTEQLAQKQCATLKKIWGQPTKYENK